MFAATNEIADRFTEEEILFRVAESEESSRVIADAVVEYACFAVHFISSDDENDVSVRIPHYVRFTDRERNAVLKVANQMNNKYRFCKFSVNTDAEAVTLEYDFPEENRNVAEGAVEIFHRILQIAQDAYPEFMRAIWATEHDAPNLGRIVFHDFEV
ncbi:MAG: YbjN domain-containing protein [Oscillospiraceae bacterium]|nr:YbjN domain-containing protein [Oscillospiraceae bacterium]